MTRKEPTVKQVAQAIFQQQDRDAAPWPFGFSDILKLVEDLGADVAITYQDEIVISLGFGKNPDAVVKEVKRGVWTKGR